MFSNELDSESNKKASGVRKFVEEVKSDEISEEPAQEKNDEKKLALENLMVALSTTASVSIENSFQSLHVSF